MAKGKGSGEPEPFVLAGCTSLTVGNVLLLLSVVASGSRQTCDGVGKFLETGTMLRLPPRLELEKVGTPPVGLEGRQRVVDIGDQAVSNLTLNLPG